MKPVSKLAATVAMALSIGALPQANAQMELKSGGVGDALLFPVFDGRVDNYFTISNNSGDWVQAHIRFRNALTCTEVLDFDMIFSPGDVFVFRIHPDGDTWVIDKSLDPHNFEYVGLENAELKPNSLLLLSDNDVTPAESDHANWSGYIEVIGEGVFVGKGNDNTGLQSKLWSWVSAPAFNGPNTAADMPNMLSGTAMIGIPGQGLGIAYNAEAIVNFRTTGGIHRVDNYPIDNGVILHSNSADDQRHGPSPLGDYLFGFKDGSVQPRFVEDRPDELALSFTTTWGPTLLDGDDNNGFVNDQWDAAFSVQNSLFEVMNAIHETGQIFTSFYFDHGNMNDNDNANSMSLFFAFFPTKFAIGQSIDWRGQTQFENFVKLASEANMGVGKSIVYEVWNHDEVWGSCSGYQEPGALISPSYPGKITYCDSLVLGQCVTRFGMSFFKDTFDDNDASKNFRNGRVVFACDKDGGACDLNADNAVGGTLPFLSYTFDIGGSDIGRWRSMSQR